jgi:hypothetical protein
VSSGEQFRRSLYVRGPKDSREPPTQFPFGRRAGAGPRSALGRMRGSVDGLQPRRHDEQVALGGCELGVSEECLDVADGGSVFQKVHGAGVSQHVRGNALGDLRA